MYKTCFLTIKKQRVEFNIESPSFDFNVVSFRRWPSSNKELKCSFFWWSSWSETESVDVRWPYLLGVIKKGGYGQICAAQTTALLQSWTYLMDVVFDVASYHTCTQEPHNSCVISTSHITWWLGDATHAISKLGDFLPLPKQNSRHS